MPDSASSPATARDQLRALVLAHGASVVNDRVRCRSLIRDYCISDRRAANLAVAALDDGVPEALAGLSPNVLRMRAASLQKRLQTDHGLTPLAAQSAVMNWIVALGLGNGGSVPDEVTDQNDAAAGEKKQSKPRSFLVSYVGWVVAAGVAAITVPIAYTSSNQADDWFRQYASANAQATFLQNDVNTLKAQVELKQGLPDPHFHHVTWPPTTLHSASIFESEKATVKIGMTMDGQTGTATAVTTNAQGQSTSATFQARLASVSQNVLTNYQRYAIELSSPGSNLAQQTLYIEVPNDAHYHIIRLCPGTTVSDEIILGCMTP